jgi:flagellar biosynthesis anti-sigma factor FlgM
MKVERNPRGVTQPYRAVGVNPNAAQSDEPATRAAGMTTAQADQVTFSAQARQVAAVRRQLKAAPAVRMDLVERLKAAVDAGEYNVPPKEVAEKMLRSGVLD